MNTALPEQTASLDATESRVVMPTSVALYIDADNQSPQCAKPLLSLLGEYFDAQVASATITGNNHGQQIDRWRDELVSDVPSLAVHALTVSHRKQAADVALLMALGADLERHIRERKLVVIVSRDDLVIGAAEQTKERGCRTLIAYADSEIQTARNPHLTTLLLPATGKASTVAALAATATPPDPQPTKSPNDAVASVLAQLRLICTQKPGGGYSASDVGQALSKLGYDKSARVRFLAAVPGLKKRGAGPDLILVF